MATYTIKINERTAWGQALVEYLKNLPIDFIPERVKSAQKKRYDQEQMVKEDLTRVFEQMAEYEKSGKEFKDAYDFLQELEEEEQK